MSALRILLVEDNAANSELVFDLLELDGHTVELLCDGASFRARIAHAPRPDIVLMDELLPDVTGVELVAEVRASASLGTIPMVAVTALAQGSDVERIRRAGYDGVITKPIDTRTFVAVVKAYVRSAP